MGDGMKRATLAALLTRGPWATVTGRGDSRELTSAQVLAFYEAIPDREAMCRAVDTPALTNRPADRAATLLRKAGLIRYNRETRLWGRT